MSTPPPDPSDYEALVELGDVTLWRNTKTNEVFLQADDPFYHGQVTPDLAEQIVRSLLGVEGLLDITDEQADMILSFWEKRSGQ